MWGMTRVSLIAGPIVTATLSALWGNRVVQVLTGLAVMTLVYLFLKKRFTPPDPKEVLRVLPSYPTTEELIRWAWGKELPPHLAYDWRKDPRAYGLGVSPDELLG
jgi:hypothetical protein